ncbi:uncharacterized protein LOC120669082 [Panicum virgatum]|uniref:uncharacterized protein LOC120669082 n=1 Tax=Panicum virgatum TaxID=38727 RepID=UPI0019D5A584|nr:uncharacterized protein LOC120669082 [Panicum virgatum]
MRTAIHRRAVKVVQVTSNALALVNATTEVLPFLPISVQQSTRISSTGSDSTCVFCHHRLDEVMSKLKDPDAEFEIIQILIKECNKIEGHVQQCKRLVLQYIPLIMVNGEKFLEKNNDVCVQACMNVTVWM